MTTKSILCQWLKQNIFFFKKKKSSPQLEVKLLVLCERKKDSGHSVLDTLPGAPNRTQSWCPDAINCQLWFWGNSWFPKHDVSLGPLGQIKSLMYKPTPQPHEHTLNGDLSKPPNKELPLPALANKCSHQGTRWRASRREHWKEAISASNDFRSLDSEHTPWALCTHTQSGHIHQRMPLQMPLCRF